MEEIIIVLSNAYHPA